MYGYHFTPKNRMDSINTQGLLPKQKTTLSLEEKEEIFFFSHLGDIYYLMLLRKLELEDYEILKVDLHEMMDKIKIINRWQFGVEFTVKEKITPNPLTPFA